ncbi:MAG TPA: hypothetical protein VK603_22700, partial [Candidatus Saccharimonadales bacterium]|nr:hypothetical protein [Candidatus Saccharimonadales bacterium]
MKPIQYRRERYKAEEGRAEFFVARPDPTHALDASKEVFDDVAMGIKQLGVVVLGLLERRGGMQGVALRAISSRRKVSASNPRSPITQHSASCSTSVATARRSFRLPG